VNEVLKTQQYDCIARAVDTHTHTHTRVNKNIYFLRLTERSRYLCGRYV